MQSFHILLQRASEALNIISHTLKKIVLKKGFKNVRNQNKLMDLLLCFMLVLLCLDLSEWRTRQPYIYMDDLILRVIRNHRTGKKAIQINSITSRCCTHARIISCVINTDCPQGRHGVEDNTSINLWSLPAYVPFDGY